MKLLRIPRPMCEVLMRAGLQGCSGGAKEGLNVIGAIKDTCIQALYTCM